MIEVGRFCIFGDWDNTPTPEGKIRIIMPPLGHIYGAGWHKTTQNSLLALEKHLIVGQSFVEIGAGSCILSVAAKKLGAGVCYATELNPEAIEIGKRVIAANNVDINLIAGTFIDEEVDLAIISISTSFAKDNFNKIKAKRICVVHDDGGVEIV
jgi:ribosomal protein L11 methyltransferase